MLLLVTLSSDICSKIKKIQILQIKVWKEKTIDVESLVLDQKTTR